VLFRDTSWGLLIFLSHPNLRIIPLDLAYRSAVETPKEENETMKNIKQLLTKLMVEDSGQDLIEYALVAALVGLGAVAAMGTLKNAVASMFSK
jgi:pilus assembly protein Flp/PilA